MTGEVAPKISLSTFGKRLKTLAERRGSWPQDDKGREDLVLAALNPLAGPMVVLEVVKADIEAPYPDLGWPGGALDRLEAQGVVRSLEAPGRRVWLVRGTPGEPGVS